MHAEGNAGESGVGQLSQAGACHRVGIGFQGDLGVLGDADRLVKAAQDLDEFRRCQHRRRSSPEEHRLCPARFHPGIRHDARGESSLGQHGGGVVSHLRARAEADRVGVEIAVSAAHPAEGNVHVQGERAAAVDLDQVRTE